MTSKAGCKSCGSILQSERYRDAGTSWRKSSKTFPNARTSAGRPAAAAARARADPEGNSAAGRRRGSTSLLARFSPSFRPKASRANAGASPRAAGQIRGRRPRRKTVLDALQAEVALNRRRKRPRAGRGFCQGNRRRGERGRLGRLASFERLADAQADGRTESGAGDQWLACRREPCDRRFPCRRLARRTRATWSWQYLGEPLAAERSTARRRSARHGRRGDRARRADAEADEAAARRAGRRRARPGNVSSSLSPALPAKATPATSCNCRPSTIRCAIIRDRRARRRRRDPRAELDFWAGPPTRTTANRSARPRGTATSSIAVDWLQPHQTRTTIRPASITPCSARSATPAGGSRSTPTACFLTGHGIGGDAAWDIALAHPDIWAGVMPFVASPTNIVSATRPTPSICPGTSSAANSTATRWPATPASWIATSKPQQRHHGGRISGPRLRAVRRRDSAAVRLDGPPQPHDAQEFRMRDDAAVGQFLLVARGRGPACRSRWSPPPLAAAAGRAARSRSRANAWPPTS